MDEKYDCNYSEFDMQKHADTYINYLEVVIDPTGKVHYAHPSHSMFLENVAKNLYGEKRFATMLKRAISQDYITWLCEITDYCSVWSDFFVVGSGGLNENQYRTLYKLSQKKYTQMPNLSLYNGALTN